MFKRTAVVIPLAASMLASGGCLNLLSIAGHATAQTRYQGPPTVDYDFSMCVEEDNSQKNTTWDELDACMEKKGYTVKG